MAQIPSEAWNHWIDPVDRDATGQTVLEITRREDGQFDSIRLIQKSSGDSTRRILFPGSFNPLHKAHQQMASITMSRFERYPVWYEISIDNLDKPHLDRNELKERLQQPFLPGNVIVTHTGSFEAKARRFPGSIFIVGADTMARIVDPRFYRDERHRQTALEEIVRNECRFVGFARRVGDRVIEGPELELPTVLARCCEWVPRDQFCLDLSSTDIRQRKTRPHEAL